MKFTKKSMTRTKSTNLRAEPDKLVLHVDVAGTRHRTTYFKPLRNSARKQYVLKTRKGVRTERQGGYVVVWGVHVRLSTQRWLLNNVLPWHVGRGQIYLIITIIFLDDTRPTKAFEALLLKLFQSHKKYYYYHLYFCIVEMVKIDQLFLKAPLDT